MNRIRKIIAELFSLPTFDIVVNKCRKKYKGAVQEAAIYNRLTLRDGKRKSVYLFTENELMKARKRGLTQPEDGE